METALARSAAAMRSIRAPLHSSVSRPGASICRRCLLHTNATHGATPVTHPTFAGPPPQAPQPSASYPQDRLARKKQQLELLRQGQNAKVNPDKPSSALAKRFWKNVSVKETEDGMLQVLLDTRPVRTAGKQILLLPKTKRNLATAIAIEWDSLVSAQQAIKNHYIPLTSLVSRAMDFQRADAEGNTTLRDQLLPVLMRYLATDTLLCWAPEHNLHDPMEVERHAAGRSLRQRQQAAAEPIIAHLTTHIWPGVEIIPVLAPDSIIPAKQPALTQEVIRGWIAGLPPFELAGLERGVLATKSLLVAARLLVEWSSHWKELRPRVDEQEGTKVVEKFGIEEAAHAASLEVLYQTEQWGEVEDTHDVNREDLRRQLGSVVMLVS